MAVNGPTKVHDGFVSLEGGIDSGLPELLIGINQTAFAVNTSHRDGFPSPRPGWVWRNLAFPSESVRAGFQDGFFQGAGSYLSDDGVAYLCASVGGRIFTIEIDNGFGVSEITPADDPNLATQESAWFQQAERFLVVQNEINPAILFDGSGSRRAGPDEVPVGGPMAYGKGRLWVARKALYFGGDLVWGDNVYGRDNVVRFTENTFLNEGGAFGVPDGPVSGMCFAKNLDTGLGDGDLLVGTPANVYANSAPVDRTVWKNLSQPVQRFAARNYGPMSHESMVVVNGDVFYRAPDGIRTLAYARRDWQQWGDAPISRQAYRALRFDTSAWLSRCSGVNFDNRALFTMLPQYDQDHGVWHRGLAVLDFHRVSGMDRKLPPAWEGVWTGLRILRIITVQVNRMPRCFIFALSSCDQVHLWEVTKNRAFDQNGVDDVPIQWMFETRAMSFGEPNKLKRLSGGVQWFDRILGEVAVTAKYRGDSSERWHPWATWSDCVKYRDCSTETCDQAPFGTIQPIRHYRSQVRPFMGLPEPAEIPEPQTGTLSKDAWEFQVRFEITGCLRFKRLVLSADVLPQPSFGDFRNVECDAEEVEDCPTESCFGVSFCDPNDYTYQLESCNATGYPESDWVDQEYPTGSFPPEDPSEPGGLDPGQPGVPETPDEPGFGGTVPIYDPDNPSEDPTGDCSSGGSKIVVESAYVWSFGPSVNPNDSLTAGEIACHQALFAVELQAQVAYWQGLGYVVETLPNQRWTYSGSSGAFLAMFRKSTCNPNDGIDDHLVSFTGYTTIRQSICIRLPS